MEEQWIFKISFINVGNGDAILVQVKDQDYRSGCFVMVVDAGSGEQEEYENTATGRVRMSEFMEQAGIDHVDVLVNTHIHEDHICGMEEVVARWKPTVFWQPFPVELFRKMKTLETEMAISESGRKFRAALNSYQRICMEVLAAGGDLRQLVRQEEIQVAGKLHIKVLGPTQEAVNEQMKRLHMLYEAHKSGEETEEIERKLDAEMNDTSLILYLECAGHTFLLPGDTQSSGYGACKEKMKAEVFKVGHHGQENSMDEKLLEAITPSYAMICASSDRRYDSAAPQVLKMLYQAGAELCFTDTPNVPPFTDELKPHCGVCAEILHNGSMSVKYLL